MIVFLFFYRRAHRLNGLQVGIKPARPEAMLESSWKPKAQYIPDRNNGLKAAFLARGVSGCGWFSRIG